MIWPGMHFSLRCQCKRCSARRLHPDMDDDALDMSEYYRDPQSFRALRKENRKMIQLLAPAKVAENRIKLLNCYR